MPNRSLCLNAAQEITEAMRGLSGALARAEALRLAARHGCSVSRVYDLSRDVRPGRRIRADRGTRAADLLADPFLSFAAEKIVAYNLDPESAVEIAECNPEETGGKQCPVSLATVRRYVREHGLNRRALREGRRPHRRFEASAPGELFQVDFSGVKTRWLDVRTRRILHVPATEVSANHPNRNPDRVPLWKCSVVDDYSRMKFIRFVAAPRLNSGDAIDFLLEAFRALGVPLKLYSDNDSILLSQRMKRAERMLAEAFADSGGFLMDQHAPGEAQATGKVENSHQFFEKFERWIGVKRVTPDLDALQGFAAYICERMNHRAHRETGETPVLRWHSVRTLVRTPPPALLDAAFKAEEHECVLRADMSISLLKGKFRVPGSKPFIDWIGLPVRVVAPLGAAFFVILAPPNTREAGNEYTIDRVPFAADRAGEYKRHAESTGQQTAKALRARAAERRRAHKEAGTDIRVPGFDTAFDHAAQPVPFPQPKKPMDAALLDAIAPGALSVAAAQAEIVDLRAADDESDSSPAFVEGRPFNFYDAIELLQAEGLFAVPVSAADRAWLKCIFRDRADVLDTELRAEAAARASRPEASLLRSA